MKILIGILAHQLESETVKAVHTLDSDDDGYHVLTLWGGDIRPGETRFQAVTRKYQELQRVFLAGPWDALLTVEQDMLIPPHALTSLTRLIADGADVAYGLYVWRYEEQLWWNAHPKIEADAEGMPWFWSLTQYPEQARQHWGQPVIVAGLGMGCTLFSRHALARIPFRQGRADHCCDTTFALDAGAEGLIQIADLSVACGHYMGRDRIVWPDPEAEGLYRIERTDA